MPYRVLMAFHVISVISWMAGILYLYRLFVYHAEEKEAVVRERFTLMELRLSRMIMMPAMGLSLLFGVLMLIEIPALLTQGWMHFKLAAVAGMIFLTHRALTHRKELASGTNKRSARYFRILNEMPTLLMILIVFLVILKPMS